MKLTVKELREFVKVNLPLVVVPDDVKGIRGVVRKHLGDAIRDDHMRKLMMCWLLRPDEPLHELSTNDLTDREVMVLKLWINPSKIADEWIPREGFNEEVELIYNEVKKIIDADGMVGEAIRLGGVVKEVNELYRFD